MLLDVKPWDNLVEPLSRAVHYGRCVTIPPGSYYLERPFVVLAPLSRVNINATEVRLWPRKDAYDWSTHPGGVIYIGGVGTDRKDRLDGLRISGLVLEDLPCSGIVVTRAMDVHLSDITIRRAARIGIAVWECWDVHMRECTAFRCEQGLQAIATTKNPNNGLFLHSCIFERNREGQVDLYASHSVTMTGGKLHGTSLENDPYLLRAKDCIGVSLTGNILAWGAKEAIQAWNTEVTMFGNVWQQRKGSSNDSQSE